jgi:hypothetical protein
MYSPFQFVVFYKPNLEEESKKKKIDDMNLAITQGSIYLLEMNMQ